MLWCRWFNEFKIKTVLSTARSAALSFTTALHTHRNFNLCQRICVCTDCPGRRNCVFCKCEWIVAVECAAYGGLTRHQNYLNMYYNSTNYIQSKMNTIKSQTPFHHIQAAWSLKPHRAARNNDLNASTQPLLHRSLLPIPPLLVNSCAFLHSS